VALKLLLSISAQQISAARWRGSSFTTCTLFANDEDGIAAFKRYLAQTPHQPVYLMVDAVGEDYRLELLPHSFGSERAEMVERKLKQHYRNTPYSSAHLQERDSGKRRDDRYLFCALTTPDLVEPWVQAVLERGLPLAGIYLLPTVGQRLLEKLQIKAPNLLLVSVHSAGMRLTYFRDQKLRLSRLAQTDSGQLQAIKNLAEEVSNTRLYLHGLRVMTLDEHLTILVVDRDDRLHELVQTIARDNPNAECHRLGREEVIAKLGVSARALDSSPKALYLHLLGLRAPADNLAPADVTIGYRQHRAQNIGYALAGVAALGAIGWCAVNLMLMLYTHGQTEDAARATLQQQAQYQEATRQFPVAPTSAENLERAVEVAQKIVGTTRTPQTLMGIVSRALDANPAIVLKTLGWKYGPTDIGTEGKIASPAASTTPGGSRHQSGLIEGEVRPFRGDYRAAIESINRFVAALTQQPEVEQVKVVQLPLNVGSDLTLSGNTVSDAAQQTGKAEFKLLVILKQNV